MPDPISLIGGALETVKKLREISEKVKDADTRNLIADLNIALADLKSEIASLKEENVRLTEELKQKKARDSYNELVVRDGVLYFTEPPPGKPEGPYCPNCKENNNRLVLIQDLRDSPRSAFGEFTCRICNSFFGRGL